MEEKTIIGYQKSWHDTNIRWIALTLACLMECGNYYCYDFPAVLEAQIKAQFDVDSFQCDLLYTLYSMPNIILPLVGGVLIDYSGFKVAIIGFNLALVFGQGLCFVGSVTNKYYLLLIGRVIYGLGGDNMNVLQSVITCKWFNGKEIAFALGLNITVSMIGSISNSNISPKLEAINGNISTPLFAGFCFLVISSIGSFVLLYIDTECDKRDLTYQLEEVAIEKIQLKDCKQFKIDLYMVVLSCMLCYSNLFVFQQNNILMFQTMFNLNKTQANIMYQIPYYTGAVFIPFIGFLIDKVGGRPFFLIIASILLLFVDLWYLLVPFCSEICFVYPITGQIVLAIFYTFYAAVLWTVVPLCVPQKTVGTAFGMAFSAQNTGLTLCPLIVGFLTNSGTILSYRHMMQFFTVIGVFSLTDHIFIKLYDKFQIKGELSKNSQGLKQLIINPQIEMSDNASIQYI